MTIEIKRYKDWLEIIDIDKDGDIIKTFHVSIPQIHYMSPEYTVPKFQIYFATTNLTIHFDNSVQVSAFEKNIISIIQKRINFDGQPTG
jgi:hypothetical protein